VKFVLKNIVWLFKSVIFDDGVGGDDHDDNDNDG
jgi:hypothetical protein